MRSPRCSPEARTLLTTPKMSDDGWETDESDEIAFVEAVEATPSLSAISNYKCSKNRFGQMEYYLTTNQETIAKAGVNDAIRRLQLIASSWNIDRNPSGSSFLKHNSVQAYNKHYKGLQFFLLLIGIQYFM